MRIEHVALYVNDLENTKKFFMKYLGAKSNAGYHNQKTGFYSYFLTFEDGARIEIMNLPEMADLEEINYRAMMGEYIIYYRGRIVGGIYDDRLLVKPTKSAVSYMATAIYELPYEGAKEMLLVEDVDSKEYLAGLFKAMYDELPVHKSNNKIMKF